MVARTADILGFGEVAEWFKAAVLKTAVENIDTPHKSANPADFLAAISAFYIRSRGTSRHGKRHNG